MDEEGLRELQARAGRLANALIHIKALVQWCSDADVSPDYRKKIIDYVEKAWGDY